MIIKMYGVDSSVIIVIVCNVARVKGQIAPWTFFFSQRLNTVWMNELYFVNRGLQPKYVWGFVTCWVNYPISASYPTDKNRSTLICSTRLSVKSRTEEKVPNSLVKFRRNFKTGILGFCSLTDGLSSLNVIKNRIAVRKNTHTLQGLATDMHIIIALLAAALLYNASFFFKSQKNKKQKEEIGWKWWRRFISQRVHTNSVGTGSDWREVYHCVLCGFLV